MININPFASHVLAHVAQNYALVFLFHICTLQIILLAIAKTFDNPSPTFAIEINILSEISKTLSSQRGWLPLMWLQVNRLTLIAKTETIRSSVRKV
jgi:hypothetical protein